MRTYSVQTLGCKVNQYESEQIATLLRERGLVASDSPDHADLRVINTCSVTIQAAGKSRQTIRRTTRLKVLGSPDFFYQPPASPRQRTIVTGCWATSDPEAVMRLAGVDAVLGHHDDVASKLNRLLDGWCGQSHEIGELTATYAHTVSSQRSGDDVSRVPAGDPPLQLTSNCTPKTAHLIEKKHPVGTHSLPLLGQRQSGHQRALLKIQDGCDAHCTYCIIPRLRPVLWSKPIGEVVDEARRLVDAGHVELVLTGIFLGAYGQPTALRHRQPGRPGPLGDLIETLCTQIPHLRRLRLSSLEPGDLTPQLISIMKSHEAVVPHLHLPLQSGSDPILRRMNRQYGRDDFLRMIDDVNAAFDRPAITTDIIVGFPGETDAEFEQTLDMVDRIRFIHIHAFSFSPRPQTAAARWGSDFVRGPVVNQRINTLTARSEAHSHAFRQQFLGQTVELLVERPRPFDTLRHGRCSRYFDVYFDDPTARAGDAVNVTIDRVTPRRTLGHRA